MGYSLRDRYGQSVPDHYTSKNGIANVNSRQTVHGVGIDDAIFKVHMSRMAGMLLTKSWCYDR